MSAIDTDNRDKDEIINYQEARIEVLLERVRELERQLRDLRALNGNHP